MVQIKKLTLQAEIEIDIPNDIAQNKHRLTEVENGLAKSITVGFYQQGVDFKVKKLKFKID